MGEFFAFCISNVLTISWLYLRQLFSTIYPLVLSYLQNFRRFNSVRGKIGIEFPKRKWDWKEKIDKEKE